MKLRILDASTLGEDLDLSVFRAFGSLEIYEKTEKDQLISRISDADVLILNKIKLGAEELQYAKNLQLICVAATGYDNIDIACCREKGIAVCNVPGYSVFSVSQITLAMALSLWCRLPQFSACVAEGEYTHGGVANRLTPVYREICGKTWGILGFGGIGKQVAKAAEALGCRVLYTKRTPDGGEGCVDLETLCRESDILSVHTPLTSQTRGMIDAEHLSMMKSDAVLINVARGAVLDEAAVAKAIAEGKLGGFGCDVYSVEPLPETHPFFNIRQYPNVCLTPHMAWGAYESRLRCRDQMADNIRAFLRGEKENRVDLI